jgi:sulfite exporter TauE/SafE
MIALVSAVFIASLLGSMHCAGMCGAFVAFAVTGDGERRTSRNALNAAYNAGRLVTYTILGGIAGALGAAMDLGGSMIGAQRSAAIAAGGMMIGFGVVSLLRVRGVKIARRPLPASWSRIVAAGHRRAFDLPPMWRSLLVGILTVLLPCGWLYAFVITAAGTGSALLGVLTMAVFWLDTLPMTMTIGYGVQAISGPLRAHLPLATSLLVVAVGLWTVIGRLRLPPIEPQHAVVNVSLHDAARHVHELNADEMPCCHDR